MRNHDSKSGWRAEFEGDLLNFKLSCYQIKSLKYNLTFQVRTCPLRLPVGKDTNFLETLSVDQFIVEYDEPNADLYKFNGLLHSTHAPLQKPVGLCMDNVLLRGTAIKNSCFIYGLVIYTGNDTRLSLNSTELRLGKFSVIDV